MSNTAASKRHNAAWHYLVIIAVMLLLGGSAGAWYLWPKPAQQNARNPTNGLPANALQSLFGGMQNMRNMQMIKGGSEKTTKGEKKDSNKKTEKSGDKPAPKTTEDEKKDSNKKTEKSGDKPKTQTIIMDGPMTDDQKKDLEKAMAKLGNNKGGKGGFLPFGNSVVMPEGSGAKKPSGNPMVKPGGNGSKKPELVGSKLASLLVLLTSVVGSGCFLWLALRQRKVDAG